MSKLRKMLKPQPQEQTQEVQTPRTQEERDRQAREVEDNAKIFYDELLADLLKEGHKGEYALMHDGKVVEILDDFVKAFFRGKELFADEPFSVQRISDEPLSIGIPAARIVTDRDRVD